MAILIGATPGCPPQVVPPPPPSPPQSYVIGNATPSGSFAVQGQSFTPSDFGNESSGSLPASSPGTVFLTSFTIDYDFSVATAYPVLYLYSSPPSATDAATGAGSLATGTLVSGGEYAFSRVAVDYTTKYYAVLPGSASIFDNSGNTYTGGVDMFPQGGTVAEGGGDFDIGFNATFEFP
jgi:hypothetical protein